MDIVKFILCLIFGSGTIAYLAKAFINNYFSNSLEEYKAKLAKEAVVHRVRYEKMHEERAEVIKILYQKIVKAYRAFYFYMDPRELPTNLTHVEMGEAAANMANDFDNYYEENRIFIDEKLAKEIDKLSNAFRDAWGESQQSIESRQAQEPYMHKVQKSWIIMREEAPKIKKNIEYEFREILGINVEEKSQ